jgi:hypothetical protein
MVWVCIALAIPALALLLLHFLRFHFHLSVESPSTLRGAVGVSFFGFRREVAVDAARAVWGHGEHNGDDDEDDGEDGHEDDAADLASDAFGGDARGGQRGALRVPEAWLRLAARLQTRLRKAATKWVLDPGVWRILLRFAWKSGRRVLGLLHPAPEFLHLSLEDVFALGRIAAVWAVLRGTLPALACPAEFGFAQPFALRARLAGGFTGLDLVVFGLLTLFSFPWAPLGSRFLHCWRDPRLTRWQRRVLLP